MRYAIVTDVQMEDESELYQLEFYKLDTVSQSYFKDEVFSSKSAKYLSRTGKHTWFWKNGQKMQEGMREKGDKVGIWTHWYEDGTKESEYEYFEPEDTPKSKQKGYHMINFWNKEGVQTVKNGTGNYFFKYEDGDEVMGEMVNYNKEGLWKGFRKNGNKWYAEIYKEGELVQGESWDEEGNRYTYISMYERAEYPGGQQAIAQLIKKNFKVPEYATKRGIEGLIKVYFKVNKEGNVEGIDVSKSLCEPCDQEAIRIVKMMEQWKPGKKRGQYYVAPHSLPFRIRLE